MHARLTKVTPVLAAIAALGIGGSAFAYAQGNGAQPVKAPNAAVQPAAMPQDNPAAEQKDDQAGEQNPTFRSSITASEQERGGEAAEAQALQSKATTSAAEAKSAALAAVPGTAGQVELDNENGNVVYSVEITKADGSLIDVKVDAGNATVLHQQADDAGDAGEHGDAGEQPGAAEGSEAPEPAR